MNGLEHIFLHLNLCGAISKLPSETVVPIHVQMAYRVGEPPLNKTFRVTRGDGTQAVIEFDIPRDIYRLQVDAPKYHCSTADFLEVLVDHDRNVTETLTSDAPEPDDPVTLLAGTAPLSFTYIKPTFALFDKSVVCGQAVPPPLPAKIRVEYDQGAYYVWLYPDPSLDAHAPVVVALRLRTTTGTAHYVHLPIPFPTAWGGWPNVTRFEVSEEMIDGLATDKVDTLLCPKLWETSAH